jgi:KEOPS complex subunit Cgi121
MKDFPEEEVAVAGILGPLRLEDILFVARKSNRIGPLQVVRAGIVVGTDHVRSAALHARRAEREGRMQAKTIEVEFTRYLAGERQIKSALEKAGVRDGEQAAAVVALGAKRLDTLQHFLHALAPKEDDDVLAPKESKLLEFGITAKAIEATTPSRRKDLILEAVAGVDLH